MTNSALAQTPLMLSAQTISNYHAGTPEGVLHGFGSFFTFTNCTFMGNHGRQTGVMNIENGDATFDSCQFINNQGNQVRSTLTCKVTSMLHVCMPLALVGSTLNLLTCQQRSRN